MRIFGSWSQFWPFLSSVSWLFLTLRHPSTMSPPFQAPATHPYSGLTPSALKSWNGLFTALLAFCCFCAPTKSRFSARWNEHSTALAWPCPAHSPLISMFDAFHGILQSIFPALPRWCSLTLCFFFFFFFGGMSAISPQPPPTTSQGSM